MNLTKKGIFFLTNLPSYKQIENILGLQETNKQRKKTVVLRKKLQSTTSKRDSITPLIICDRKLQSVPKIRSWLKNYLVYFVSAGEKLKDIEHFSAHINNILKKAKNKNISTFVSLGGGSVGDFTGFLASVYKRGVPLIHIPTTWLSAMDSAHGGKTALNVVPIKNLLGSYCFPKAVFIVKPLLFSLPEKENKSAKGELVKIALIKGGSFYKDLSKKKVFTKKNLWCFLPQAISSKLEIVEKDPYDEKRIRCVLNFGHTLGHVLESHFRIPHGEAVIYGMVFALKWSHKRFTLPSSFLKQLPFTIGTQKKVCFYLKKIPPRMLYALLLQDKKRIEEEKINFIFIKKPGKVFSENVFVKDIIKEIQRQIL